jgi:hypothetical protein
MTTVLPILAMLLAPPAPKEQDKPPPDVTYTVPAGWERVEQDHVVVLTPPGTAAEKCSLVLTRGEKLKGEFPEWFDDRWDALRKGAKVVQGGDRPAPREGPNGSSFIVRSALLEAKKEGEEPRRTGLLLYAVHVGDAVHWVVFRTDGPALFNEHKKTVNRFLAGLQFYETTTEVRPAKPRPGGKGARN